LPEAELHGVKYDDKNCNGTFDAGDVPLPNWIIELNTIWWGYQYDTTDALGQYAFYNLNAGYHVLNEIQQPGWVQTAPSSVNYQLFIPSFNAVINNLDFGNLDPQLCDTTMADTCMAGAKDDFLGGTPRFPRRRPTSSRSCWRCARGRRC